MYVVLCGTFWVYRVELGPGSLELGSDVQAFTEALLSSITLCLDIQITSKESAPLHTITIIIKRGITHITTHPSSIPDASPITLRHVAQRRC